MTINIFQGNDLLLKPSDITIVIDVIRAFTVAHYAFLGGAKNIWLVSSVDEAFQIKDRFPHYLLAGEVRGLPIEGFDLDNSPARVFMTNVLGKTLVQKTTNGVTATFHSLHANNLFVTGFSNARTTALYVRKLIQESNREQLVHIVASHPTGDDDLACAEYIMGIIEEKEVLSEADVANRIKSSHAAGKFFDISQPEFNRADIDYCAKELKEKFVMRVKKENEFPVIERLQV